MRRRIKLERELYFGVAWSSLPACLYCAGGKSRGVQSLNWVRRGVECECYLFRRQVTQMKKDERVLDCRWFWLGSLLGGFVRRMCCGDDGGFRNLSCSGREMLRGREPLIQLSLAAKASAKNPALHFR